MDQLVKFLLLPVNSISFLFRHQLTLRLDVLSDLCQLIFIKFLPNVLVFIIVHYGFRGEVNHRLLETRTSLLHLIVQFLLDLQGCFNTLVIYCLSTRLMYVLLHPLLYSFVSLNFLLDCRCHTRLFIFDYGLETDEARSVVDCQFLLLFRHYGRLSLPS